MYVAWDLLADQVPKMAPVYGVDIIYMVCRRSWGWGGYFAGSDGYSIN